MATLTPSGEVCNFIDDNQFGSNESQDKCGPEAIALFWHSTKPAIHNPYTSHDVHTQAHDLYTRFIGQDTANNEQGTDNTTLYKMLDYVGFKYLKYPFANDSDKAWPWVRGWLNAGYPVIIGGVPESAVKDHDLKDSNPYNWNTSGITHIFLATGPEKPGYVKVRDTANIDKNGVVRSGPRTYLTTGLTMSTATMVIPSWLPVPTSNEPPVTTIEDWKQEILTHCAAIEKLIGANS